MRMGQLQQRNVSFMFGRGVFDCMPNLLVGWWEIVGSRICVCMSGGVCVAGAFVFVRADLCVSVCASSGLGCCAFVFGKLLLRLGGFAYKHRVYCASRLRVRVRCFDVCCLLRPSWHEARRDELLHFM